MKITKTINPADQANTFFILADDYFYSGNLFGLVKGVTLIEVFCASSAGLTITESYTK